MILGCNICKAEFTNEYLLQKHMNRKVPCNVIFECLSDIKKMSDKVFTIEAPTLPVVV